MSSNCTGTAPSVRSVGGAQNGIFCRVASSGECTAKFTRNFTAWSGEVWQWSAGPPASLERSMRARPALRHIELTLRAVSHYSSSLARRDGQHENVLVADANESLHVALLDHGTRSRTGEPVRLQDGPVAEQKWVLAKAAAPTVNGIRASRSSCSLASRPWRPGTSCRPGADRHPFAGGPQRAAQSTARNRAGHRSAHLGMATGTAPPSRGAGLASTNAIMHRYG